MATPTPTGSAATAATQAIATAVIVSTATVNTDTAHEEPPKASRNVNLTIDVEGNKSVEQPHIEPIARSPGCFPLCGWTSYKIKSPVRPAAVMKDDASSPRSTVPPSSPVGSSPHCYTGGMNPCGVRQLASPVRSRGNVLSSMPTFRKYVVCAQCKSSMCAENDTRSATDLSMKPKEKPATDATQCLICCKASAFEAHLSKAFFCPGHVDGKSVKYAGLPVECYRNWFKERPMTPESVRKTHAKRTAMLTKLQRQHKLHYHKLKDVCKDICTSFSAATCFVSLADKDLELIVGNYGSMLHFSCIPREISMCDYAMGSLEQHLLVDSVAEDPVFRENPILRATKAQFYFGVPISVDGAGIGAIAVLDVRPRKDSPDPSAIAQMKQMAVMMGSRVSALLSSGSPSSFSSRMLKLLQE